MAVPKKFVDQVTNEIRDNLQSIVNKIDELPVQHSYREEALLHLIMLRTELCGIYHELDDVNINILQQDKSYTSEIKHKWDIFERIDTESRTNLKEIQSIV